ncbi:hypothetical protein [Komagataeibacter oboediens]|uniref:hypothetical protein n=1 Tax=Komagataeibacter oboediens TaxID=65958 RepID=UPI0019069CE6|nr:hypothetical protein [Komagataeibacter oboediens]
MSGINKGYDPNKVVSPKENWELVEVLYESQWWSMARGYWTDENGKRPVLAQRWNGDEGDKGNPISRGYPTWFILPSETYGLYFGSKFIPEDKRLEVITFILSKS